MVSISGLVSVVIYIIVLGLVFGLLWWLLDYVKPPEPFYKIAKIMLAVMAVLILCGVLLSLVTGTQVFRP